MSYNSETVHNRACITINYLLLQKTLQFIHLVKDTRVTRVKQQIFFVCFDPAAHPIDKINEAPLQGNFAYM